MFITKNIVTGQSVANGGTPTVVELPVPPFGWLHRLVLCQTGGTPATLTANLFEAPPETPQRTLHRVLAQQSGPSPLFWSDEQNGAVYATKGTPLTPGKKLYLDVTHNGGAPITLDLCVVLAHDDVQ